MTRRSAESLEQRECAGIETKHPAVVRLRVTIAGERHVQLVLRQEKGRSLQLLLACENRAPGSPGDRRGVTHVVSRDDVEHPQLMNDRSVRLLRGGYDIDGAATGVDHRRRHDADLPLYVLVTGRTNLRVS